MIEKEGRGKRKEEKGKRKKEREKEGKIAKLFKES